MGFFSRNNDCKFISLSMAGGIFVILFWAKFRDLNFVKENIA